MNWWVPAKDDIVRLKPGFDHSTMGHLMRQAGLSLHENKLYQVIEYIQDDQRRGLKLHEVKVAHIGGKRHVVSVGEVPGSPSIDFFTLAKEHRESNE